YSASKFALEGLIDAMRREAAPWGVEIVLVAPGSTRTRMLVSQLERVEREIGALDPKVKELYGNLYTSFRDRLVNSNQRAFPVETVAETIVHALDARTPETRYPVGPNAKDVYSMPRRMSDREIDAAR